MKPIDCVKGSVELKTVCVMVRLTKTQKRWLKQNSLSPTRIFIAAMKELGYKGD